MIRKNVLGLLAMGTVAGLLAQPTPADGFVRLVPNRRWDVQPVGFDINKNQLEGSLSDGDNGETALINSLQDPVNGWNGSGQAGGDILFIYTTNLAAVLGDGFPTFEFNDPMNICTGGCLAATLTGFFHASSGLDSIDDADIMVDSSARFTSEIEDPSANQCAANEFYIEGIMQHEVGHAIGLNHSNAAGATMAAFVGPCDIGQEDLAADDKNGANALY